MKNSSLLTAVLAVAFTGPLWAEDIKVPVGQQAKQKWVIDRPVKGMNQEQVKALFGQPHETRAPVGEPPISSWIYADYVVYFESSYVIHTVLTR